MASAFRPFIPYTDISPAEWAVRVDLAPAFNPPQGTPQKVEAQTTGDGMKTLSRHLAWPALLRKLDRRDSSFRD